MYAIIHGTEKDSGGTGRYVRMPAVEKDRHVMVPMEKNEFFLVHNNKEGVNELAVVGWLVGQ
jgi:hypothetical protein